MGAIIFLYFTASSTASVTESSAPPSISQDLMDLLNSDDSVQDPDYLPDASEMEVTPEKSSTSINRGNTVSGSTCEDPQPSSSENINNIVVKHNSKSTPNRSRRERGTPKLRGVKGDSRLIRKERKNARNLGLAYITKKGKQMPKKTMKVLEPCRSKCSEIFTDEDRQKVFNDYWAMGNHSRRMSFISGLLEIVSPKARRPR